MGIKYVHDLMDMKCRACAVMEKEKPGEQQTKSAPGKIMQFKNSLILNLEKFVIFQK